MYILTFMDMYFILFSKVIRSDKKYFIVRLKHKNSYIIVPEKLNGILLKTMHDEGTAFQKLILGGRLIV